MSDAPEKGYNVQIRVRNNHILRRIRDQYGSTSQMSKVTGISAGGVSDLLCFRQKPFLNDGSLAAVAEDLCSALGATPEELWPNEMSEVLAKKATYELELSLAEVVSLCDDTEQAVIAKQLIERWSECLTDNERAAIEAMCAGITLEQASIEMGRSKQYVHYLQRGALRKMRNRAMIDHNVRSYREALGK